VTDGVQQEGDDPRQEEDEDDIADEFERKPTDVDGYKGKDEDQQPDQDA
jgi:hypothetical protein